MANETLKSAKKNKNDEFYTQLSDIEKELAHYKQHFKGKIVLCNLKQIIAVGDKNKIKMLFETPGRATHDELAIWKQLDKS